MRSENGDAAWTDLPCGTYSGILPSTVGTSQSVTTVEHLELPKLRAKAVYLIPKKDDYRSVLRDKSLAATPQQALQSSTFAQRAGAWVLPLRNVTTVQGQPAGIWVLKIVLLQSSKNTAVRQRTEPSQQRAKRAAIKSCNKLRDWQGSS
ncbi:hypothetical protein WJX79_005912 [Trebouxia sp. C0005]